MKNLIIVLLIVVVGGALFMSVGNKKTDTMQEDTQQTMMEASPVASLPSASLSPADSTWESSQSTSVNSDDASLEKDINGTDIPAEDFSDL